ncbi:helix-turn-helix transcriptional regulator [Streptomyces sp. NPDC059568]|uniref:helix-turn-helix transcriptional regulator n=1 Tax=Streptomyces sp. NPDC059568 TaxID=3346868 RepID=UPI003692A2C0
MRELPDDDSWTIDRQRGMGERVRATRRAQNLTQEQVFLAARVDRYTLQRVEAGEDARMSTFLRIAWVLGVDLADLVREEPRPGAGDANRPGQ